MNYAADKTIEAPSDLQVEAAKENLRGDWDEDGTASVHLPYAEACDAAAKLGISWNNERETFHYAGQTFWSVSDALAFYLTALGS
jgi:hypothetical protein